jgi:hypothetical protein
MLLDESVWSVPTRIPFSRTPKHGKDRDGLQLPGICVDRRGHLKHGLYHPTLDIGVEFVSGRLFDGNADPSRLRLVTITPDSRVLVIPVEDVIADRLGRYASHPKSSRAMLQQAVQAWQLAPEIDNAYLDERIRTEKASMLDLAGFEELAANENDQP